MESTPESPVCIDQVAEYEINELMLALDAATQNGHLRPRSREEVIEYRQQYYKLSVGNILSGCFQLIPGKDQNSGISYIELGAVLLCPPPEINTREIRDTLIEAMISKARNEALENAMALISVTGHGNLKSRFL